MILRHITDELVGQVVQIISGPNTRLAVVEDVGEHDDDEIRVVSCTTGALDWIPSHHLVPTGRAACADDFTSSALAAIARRAAD